MLIAGFPAGAWGTNCYLVAPAAGEECVIIDPGHERPRESRTRSGSIG